MRARTEELDGREATALQTFENREAAVREAEDRLKAKQEEAKVMAEQAAQATPVVDRPSEVEADGSESTESSETSADDTNEN